MLIVYVLIFLLQFKIFIKQRFLYRSQPHVSYNNDDTFNSGSAFRTMGNGSINACRRPSGSEEVFRMSVIDTNSRQQRVPRAPEITFDGINGHVNPLSMQGMPCNI